MRFSPYKDDGGRILRVRGHDKDKEVSKEVAAVVAVAQRW